MTEKKVLASSLSKEHFLSNDPIFTKKSSMVIKQALSHAPKHRRKATNIDSAFRAARNKERSALQGTEGGNLGAQVSSRSLTVKPKKDVLSDWLAL